MGVNSLAIERETISVFWKLTWVYNEKAPSEAIQAWRSHRVTLYMFRKPGVFWEREKGLGWGQFKFSYRRLSVSIAQGAIGGSPKNFGGNVSQ